MIPQVQIYDNEVAIPIYGTDEYCWIVWGEDDNVDKALSRASDHPNIVKAILYDRYYVSRSDFPDDEERDYSDIVLHIYEVNCMRSDKKYFLISYDILEEFDDILNCVCIPNNKLNLFNFYSVYICPISQTKIRMG